MSLERRVTELETRLSADLETVPLVIIYKGERPEPIDDGRFRVYLPANGREFNEEQPCQ